MVSVEKREHMWNQVCSYCQSGGIPAILGTLNAFQRFYDFSANNIMLALSQNGKATEIHGVQEWQRRGATIYEDCQVINLTAPSKNRSGRWETIPVVDISDTSLAGRPLRGVPVGERWRVLKGAISSVSTLRVIEGKNQVEVHLNPNGGSYMTYNPSSLEEKRCAEVVRAFCATMTKVAAGATFVQTKYKLRLPKGKTNITANEAVVIASLMAIMVGNALGYHWGLSEAKTRKFQEDPKMFLIASYEAIRKFLRAIDEKCEMCLISRR
jgi:hypothetical protein